MGLIKESQRFVEVVMTQQKNPEISLTHAVQCACRGTYDPFFSEDELSGYNSAWSSRGLSSHILKKAPEGDAYTGSRSYLYSGAPSKQVNLD